MSAEGWCFAPERYGRLVARLWDPSRPDDLGPGQPNHALYAALSEMTVSQLFGSESRLRDLNMARCCLSGLWLLHNFLEQSHRLAQEIPTSTGSYWHGIMHRREPDYSNSKYWFRRVGNHPVFARLWQAVGQMADRAPGDAALHGFLHRQAWDPFAFIDLCQQVRGRGDAVEMFVLEVTRLEWQLLFHYSYHLATGRTVPWPGLTDPGSSDPAG